MIMDRNFQSKATQFFFLVENRVQVSQPYYMQRFLLQGVKIDNEVKNIENWATQTLTNFL